MLTLALTEYLASLTAISKYGKGLLAYIPVIPVKKFSPVFQAEWLAEYLEM